MQYEYMVPSAICLAIKVGILFLSDIRRVDRGILAFLSGAILLNAIELVLFSMGAYESPQLVWFVRFYYLAGFLCAGGIIYTAERLGKNRQRVLRWSWGFAGYGALMSLNPLVVSGYVDLGYSISALYGPLYLAVVLPLIVSMFFIVYLLGRAIKSEGRNHFRAKTLSFGLSPVIAVAVVILIGLQLGFQINATLFVSIALLFYAVVMVKNESISKFYTGIVDGRGRIDYVALSLEEGGKTAVDELKRRSAKAALKACDGDKNKAAKLLGISKVSWYRWLKAGIDEESHTDQVDSTSTSDEVPIQSDIHQPKLTLVKPGSDV